MSKLGYTMVVLIGLPKSGKSTYADKYYRDYQLLCADDIRYSLGFNYNSDAEPMVWAIHDLMLYAAIRRGRSVCIDSTNTQLHRIRHYEDIAVKYNYSFGRVIINTPIEICLSRNNGVYSVPEEIIKRMNGELKLLETVGLFEDSKVIDFKH